MNSKHDICIERLRELFCIDEAGNLVRLNSTKMSKAGSIAGYKRKDGRLEVYVDRQRFFVHRIIFALANGTWPIEQIDHINGNPSDNRPENLRHCSNTENQQNVSLRKDSTSGLIGVSFSKATNKWKAEIKSDGDTIYLGVFKSKYDAHAAYLQAKSTYHRFQPTPRTEPK